MCPLNCCTPGGVFEQGGLRLADAGEMRRAILRALVVLVPSYAMAYLTGEMVWTIPTMV